ncbi:MAG TPA: EsaB/YukD family protein, partial [Anaerolineales bacterium]|nr:EsaB/YukD family protein [Anaerolineales bacterium]
MSDRVSHPGGDRASSRSTPEGHPAGDIPVTIVLPSGGARNAEVPVDVPVRELLAELTSLLKLPTTGPDGRPMGYRLDSKALGRELL